MADESPKWYMILADEREGPYSTQDIQYLVARKRINGNTLIWQKEMRNWTPLREVETFLPKPPPEPEAKQTSEKKPASKDRRPFPFLKLGAILASLGLAAGGLYWVLNLPTEENLAPQTVRSEAQNMVHQLATDPTPQTEQALIQLGSQAVSPLLEALPPDPTSPVGGRIRHVLIAIGIPAIAPLSAHFQQQVPTGSVRIFIIQVLGDIGGLSVIPALIQTLNDPNSEVQNQAVQALANLDASTAPALAKHLTSPVHNPPPQTRKNIARALGQRADPKTKPALLQQQTLEKDLEVKQALQEALEQIEKLKRAATSQTPPAPQAAPPSQPPVHVNVQASATATASVPDKKKEEAAKHAKEGHEHLKNNELKKALEAFKQAYQLYPIAAYYLIILEMEKEVKDSTIVAAPKFEPPPLPKSPRTVTLPEIHDALLNPSVDMKIYRDALAFWQGRLDRLTPIGRDRGREQFLVQSPDGQAFVAALPYGKRRRNKLKTGDLHTWEGKLQGFKVVAQTGQVLPVLLVDEVD